MSTRPQGLRGPLWAVIAAIAVSVVAAPTAGAAPRTAPGARAAPAAAAAVDSDGDALPDSWETDGYDADGDGVIDVDLPAMGADPRHKDLFIETDWMAGRLPTETAYDRILAVFAGAPVANPDGRRGITVHLDAGGALGSAYDLGGGNEVPYDADLSPASSQTAAIKRANFDPKRARVFNYMVWADSYNGGCSSGYSFAIPGDTFIVTLGPRCSWVPSDDSSVGTFVHELGHNLGLRHGGGDDVNYKPNYLSVMNYAFQFVGVPRSEGGFSFGYSDAAMPTLDERNLREPFGLGPTAWPWRTTWRCPDGSTRATPDSAADPIDWNCDGDGLDTLSRDINRDGRIGSLTSQNNWASIRFGGGAIGGGASPSLDASRATPPPELREMTKQEFDEQQRSLRP